MTNDKSAEEIVRGRIDAIKARCEAATPGPWQDCRDYAAMVLSEDEQQRICDIRGWGHLTAVLGLSEDAAYERQLADAEFIAHTREDIPYLLGLVDSRAAEIAELRGRLDEETSRRYQAECNYDHWKTTCEHLQAQLTASQQRERAAVEFIRHLDREYSHYIADRGFEQWRRPQEAGEESR